MQPSGTEEGATGSMGSSVFSRHPPPLKEPLGEPLSCSSLGSAAWGLLKKGLLLTLTCLTGRPLGETSPVWALEGEGGGAQLKGRLLPAGIKTKPERLVCFGFL